MVHALKEIRRVLTPVGILIDLHPLCVDIPLMILTRSGWKFAGKVYRGGGWVNDVAANKAMPIMEKSETFELLKPDYFEYNWYWNALNDLRVDMEGSWKEDIRFSRGNRQIARKLLKNGSSSNRIGIPICAKLTKYQKQ